MNQANKYQLIAVQASTISWTGYLDPSFSKIDGRPVILRTLSNIVSLRPDAKVVLVAPEYDKNSEILELRKEFPKLEFFFGYNDNPLKRLIAVCTAYEQEYLIRVDGLHFCVDMDFAYKMLSLAINNDLDCVKFPDDFPIHYTADIYSKRGLLAAEDYVEKTGERKYIVHPKYLMCRNRAFRTKDMGDGGQELPTYSLNVMRENRAVFQKIRFPRHVVTTQGIKLGDLASFHYEIAAQYINDDMDVLDIACGTGYGSKMLANFARSIIGVDIDEKLIEAINSSHDFPGNLFFEYGSAEKMRFPDGRFNALTSMETIDYVDEKKYLDEVFRVLKPGGIFILSSQQNRQDYISVNAVSERGYSIEVLVEKLDPFFEIIKIFSFKAGRIYFDDDLVGRNMMIVCRKRAKSD